MKTRNWAGVVGGSAIVLYGVATMYYGNLTAELWGFNFFKLCVAAIGAYIIWRSWNGK